MRVPATERKEQLIEATVDLMRREGVQRLNLRAIAESAGASLAAVHYCFDGKDDLLRAAVEHWLSKMIDLPDLDGTNAPVGLAKTAERVADEFWASLVDNPTDVLAQIELVTWAVREASEDQLARTIYERYLADLGSLFRTALEAASQATDWNMDDFASAFLMLIDGAALQYMANPTSARPKSLLTRLLGLLLEDAVQEGPAPSHGP